MIATSRDYVYAAAQRHLKTGGLSRIHEATVVIKVKDLTTVERQQILYNHLRLGRQPRTFLEQLEPQALEAVAAHDHFLPELARRLGEPLFTKHLRYPSEGALVDFVARPSKFLGEVLVNLDPPTRAALGLVHLRGNKLPSPYQPEPGDQDFVDRVGTTLPACLSALPTLEGSLLRLVHNGGHRWWQFHHPSLTDTYRTWLAAEPELLREYLVSTPPQELLRTVTCGDVGLTGALIVPRALYDVVVKRLVTAEADQPDEDQRRWWQRRVWSFLAHRCDDAFLQAWLQHDPAPLVDAFDIGLYLSAYTAARDLAARLLNAGLASDNERRALVQQLTEYAVTAQDGSFLTDEAWLGFFTDEDLAVLDDRVRTELLPTLETVLADELAICPLDDDFCDEYRSMLDAYAARYPGYDDQIDAARDFVEDQIQAARDQAQDDAWRRFQAEARPDDDWADADRDRPDAPRRSGNRSIFDDLVELDADS